MENRHRRYFGFLKRYSIVNEGNTELKVFSKIVSKRKTK